MEVRYRNKSRRQGCQLCVLRKHPGDTTLENPIKEKRHIIVPAKDVIHLFMPLRPGQHRGVPFLASAINHLHQLDGYIEATVVGQRASSALWDLLQVQKVN